MQSRISGIVADFYPCIRQPAKLLDSSYVRSPHVGSSDDSQLPAMMDKCTKLIDDEAQAAPLDEGYQHVHAIS